MQKLEKKIICTVCPRGCHLDISYEDRSYPKNIEVHGNFCPRGIDYAHTELVNPKRKLSTSIRILGSNKPLIPVKSSEALPKAKMLDFMQEINKLVLTAPIKRGSIVLSNLLGTKIDIVATASREKTDD